VRTRPLPPMADPPREDNWQQLEFALPGLGLVLLGYVVERYRMTKTRTGEYGRS
jgi:hypothetical protein